MELHLVQDRNSLVQLRVSEANEIPIIAVIIARLDDTQTSLKVLKINRKK